MNVGTRVLSLLALSIFLLSITWAQQSPTRITIIRGFVRDADTHAALANIIVILERENSGFVAQAETDGLGKFIFTGPGQGVFTVRIRPSGYQEMTKRVDLTGSTTDYLSFEVRRTHKEPVPTIPPEGPNAELSARQSAIPENARKEFALAQQLFLEKKDLPSSLDHLRKAIKIYPNFADAYVLIAMVHIDNNNPAEARSSLQKAIEIDPNLAPAHLALGMLLNHEKDFQQAEKSLTRGLELNPDAAHGHYELAKTYWALGRWQESEIHAQKAVSLKPDMAPAHVLLGNIGLRKNDPDTALKEFKEYLRLDPNGPMAPGARQMIDKIEHAK